jgi:serine/threonine-protein kinase
MYQLRLDRTADRLVKAKNAADQAVGLDRELSEAHVALGMYWYWGLANYDRALAELDTAVRLQASNAEASRYIGNVRRRQGRFGEAIESFRRAAELNPRSHNAWYNLGETLLFVREYEQAAPYLDRVTELAPEFPEGYVQRARLVLNSRANIDTARRILSEAEERIPPASWRAPMVDLARMLHTDLQPYIGRIHPGAYGLDSATYHIVRARLLLQTGNGPAAVAQFDSARVRLEALRDERPGEAWVHGLLGWAYAGLNRPVEASRAAERAMQLLPVATDAFDGPEWLINRAAVNVLLQRPDSAAAYFDAVLAIPSWFSVNALRLDPLFKSFTSTPQFRRLQEKWPRGGIIGTGKPPAGKRAP